MRRRRCRGRLANALTNKVSNFTPIMTRSFGETVVPVALTVAVLVSAQAFGADAYPPTDPPLPKLIEPSQTEEPMVYRARRAAVMKEMGEGMAVIYAEGREDGDGYRQSSDFFYLTGVQEEGAILVLAPKERTYREFL